MYGELPAATYDDALQQFQAAAKSRDVSQPLWLMNAVWLVKAYVALGNKSAASAELKQALESVDVGREGALIDDDREAIAELKQLQTKHRLL